MCQVLYTKLFRENNFCTYRFLICILFSQFSKSFYKNDLREKNVVSERMVLHYL